MAVHMVHPSKSSMDLVVGGYIPRPKIKTQCDHCSASSDPPSSGLKLVFFEFTIEALGLEGFFSKIPLSTFRELGKVFPGAQQPYFAAHACT